MSLVNQMLKDLEQRRARLPQGDSLRGLHAAPSTASRYHSRWPLIMLLAGTSGGAFGWWLSQPAEPAFPLALPMAMAEPILPAAPVAVSVPDAGANEARLEIPAPAAARPVALAALETPAPSKPESKPAPKPPEPEQRKPAPRAQPTTAFADAAEPAVVMHKTARPLAPRQQAASHYAEALQAVRDGDTVLAESRLRTALEALPGHADSTQTLASLLVQQGRHAEAEAVLSAALDIDARQPALRTLQARLFAERGRDSEAVALLHGSSDPDALALLGAWQQRLGRHGEAAAAYRQALQRIPQRGAWWLGLAISLEQGRQPAAALAAYRRALADSTLDAQVGGYVRGRIAALGSGQG